MLVFCCVDLQRRRVKFVYTGISILIFVSFRALTFCAKFVHFGRFFSELIYHDSDLLEYWEFRLTVAKRLFSVIFTGFGPDY